MDEKLTLATSGKMPVNATSSAVIEHPKNAIIRGEVWDEGKVRGVMLTVLNEDKPESPVAAIEIAVIRRQNAPYKADMTVIWRDPSSPPDKAINRQLEGSGIRLTSASVDFSGGINTQFLQGRGVIKAGAYLNHQTVYLETDKAFNENRLKEVLDIFHQKSLIGDEALQTARRFVAEAKAKIAGMSAAAPVGTGDLADLPEKQAIGKATGHVRKSLPSGGRGA